MGPSYVQAEAAVNGRQNRFLAHFLFLRITNDPWATPRHRSETQPILEIGRPEGVAPQNVIKRQAMRIDYLLIQRLQKLISIDRRPRQRQPLATQTILHKNKQSATVALQEWVRISP